ncbi:PARP1 polymerase, partial [Polypterus senegalus]
MGHDYNLSLLREVCDDDDIEDLEVDKMTSKEHKINWAHKPTKEVVINPLRLILQEKYQDITPLCLQPPILSPMFDGKVPHWHHFSCFWQRARVLSPGDIDGYSDLRWEDQEKVKKAIESGEATATGIGGKKGDGRSEKTLNDFAVEYAKSNRSTCKGCEQKIEKELIRLSKKMIDPEKPQLGMIDRWYHIACFVSRREELGFMAAYNASQMKGFAILRTEDKEELKQRLPVLKSEGKRKADEIDGDLSFKKKMKKSEKEDKQLEKQLKILDRVSDGMAFGALQPCEQCQGQLVFKSDGYYCSGNITAWTKCVFKTQIPNRKEWIIPKEFHEVVFLKKFKFKPQDRLFAPVPPQCHPKTTESNASSIKEETVPSDKPLTNMMVICIGKLVKNKEEIKAVIEELGGKLTGSANKATICISTKKEVQKLSKKMEEVKAANVRVVVEEFLSEVKTSGKAVQELLSLHAISPWGAEVKQETPVIVTKSTGLEKCAHVLDQNGKIFSATLGLVDISRGTNSYYKLQLLEDDSKKRYWVFRSWGRVGTTIGGNKLDKFSDKNSAIDAFVSIYEEKTGNTWHSAKFTKFPNKFYPLEIDYGQDEEAVRRLTASAGTKSVLAKPVQELIKMIFDVESMKKAMVEFETVSTGGTESQVLDLSNRFYTLIPHDFGMKKPPLLNNLDYIQAKVQMLDNLLDIEVAYSLLRGGAEDDNKDPIDINYEKLKTVIEISGHGVIGTRPILMHSAPEMYGAEDKLMEVDLEGLALCKGECTPKSQYPCDETVFELCCLLMEEKGWNAPTNAFSDAELYTLLRNEILNEISDL